MKKVKLKKISKLSSCENNKVLKYKGKFKKVYTISKCELCK